MGALRKFRASKTFAVLMVCTAIYTDMMLANLVAPVLPFALSDLIGLQESEVQKWNAILLALYGTSLTLGSVCVGFITERVRNKQAPFLWGLIILALTTVAFATGRTLPILVVARVLQGLSSAVVFCIGFAILLDAVGKARMGTMSGWANFSISLGLLTGPILGGLLYEYVGYVEVFLPAVGLLVVDIIMRFMYLPGKAKPFPRATSRLIHRPSMDVIGPTPSPVQPCSPRSASESDPLLTKPPSDRVPQSTSKEFGDSPGSQIVMLLSTPRFLIVILGVLLLCSVPAGLDATLPVYLKDSFGLSPAQTAPFFMLLGGPLILAPLAGVMADRLGPKIPAALAFACLATGMVGLRFITPQLKAWKAPLLILLGFTGLGATFGFPPMATEVANAVAAIEEGSSGRLQPGEGPYTLAYSLMNAASASGSVIGPLYAGMTKDTLGWSWTTTSFGIMGLVLLLLVLLFTGDGTSNRSNIAVDHDSQQEDAAVRP